MALSTAGGLCVYSTLLHAFNLLVILLLSVLYIVHEDVKIHLS